ncbi:nucleotidyltransferase family protein [Methylobacterium frigidaeris]|uniref:nucleotidyltransferase family protein n=2 Tax=Methylobacterium frigidaeris TaxID=2038277 RepID=UPI001EDFD514|nr:GSU2403 family nucleotidyltransferase fold protein [Methylobacterium frigidaeris]
MSPREARYGFSRKSHNGPAIRRIDLQSSTLYAQLAQRCRDGRFTTAFDIDGRFEATTVKGRRHWYFVTSVAGQRQRRYVGLADDPEVAARVENFAHVRDDPRIRRRLVATLVREAYLPRPVAETGEVVQALADAGFVSVRGVRVGTVAFQCYAGLLGCRLPNGMLQTSGADFARFHSISLTVADTIPPVLEVLRAVDPTFRPVPHQGDAIWAMRFETRTGCRVEFLTPDRAGDEHAGRPATMPALGGAAAEPLRDLDFLIDRPVRAVMRHGPGIAVAIPAPVRYAVHELIVTACRDPRVASSAAKRRKDLQQAATLIDALAADGRSTDLGDALHEAWGRGPSWRAALEAGVALSVGMEGVEAVRDPPRRALAASGETPDDDL